MSLIHYQPGGGYHVVGSSRQGPQGATGPTGPIGLTGSTGAVGPQGPGVVVSTFNAINGGSVVLTTSYAVILSTTITTTSSGHILGHATVQIRNSDNIDHFCDFYLVVNGGTSNLTTEDIRKPSGGVDGYGNLTIIYRCPVVPAGTYPLQIYGRIQAAVNQPNSVVVDHADLSGLGNLT